MESVPPEFFALWINKCYKISNHLNFYILDISFYWNETETEVSADRALSKNEKKIAKSKEI